MKRNILILLGVVAVLVVGFVFFNQPAQENNQEADFDPSIYFEGDPVTQEEIDSVLTEEERQEIDRIYNEEPQKSSQ